jgi:hypothetical protein
MTQKGCEQNSKQSIGNIGINKKKKAQFSHSKFKCHLQDKLNGDET